MLRVIIVDDEMWAARRLNRILLERDEAMDIETFLNPRKALEYVRTHKVDIAFLDISMPDINGMKLSQLFLELQSDIHLVFVTGFHKYAVKAYGINAMDYIMKPVTAERLALTMNRIAANRSSG